MDDLFKRYAENLGPDVTLRKTEDGYRIDAKDDANPICDFCSDKPAPYVMGARNVKIESAALESMSEGDWAACATCKRLIEIDDRRALLYHSASRFRVKHPEVELETVRAIIWSAHKAYFKSRLKPH